METPSIPADLRRLTSIEFPLMVAECGCQYIGHIKVSACDPGEEELSICAKPVPTLPPLREATHDEKIAFLCDLRRYLRNSWKFTLVKSLFTT